MVCAGAIKQPQKPISEPASIDTNVTDNVAKNAPTIDTGVKAEKPKRRRKADK